MSARGGGSSHILTIAERRAGQRTQAADAGRCRQLLRLRHHVEREPRGKARQDEQGGPAIEQSPGRLAARPARDAPKVVTHAARRAALFNPTELFLEAQAVVVVALIGDFAVRDVHPRDAIESEGLAGRRRVRPLGAGVGLTEGPLERADDGSDRGIGYRHRAIRHDARGPDCTCRRGESAKTRQVTPKRAINAPA